MNLNLNLKYLASVREALGKSDERLSTTATTVSQVRDELIARGGTYAQVLALDNPVRMAHNQVMCASDTPVADGDEVAFFPPVTGG